MNLALKQWQEAFAREPVTALDRLVRGLVSLGAAGQLSLGEILSRAFAPGDAALIYIYALRALFIALLVAALLVTKQRRALALLSACAVVMPVGDALLTSAAGAPTATVLRHTAIAIYLLVTAFALWPRSAKVDAA